MPWFARLFIAACVAAAGLFLLGWLAARADPVVHRIEVVMPDWPRGAAPVRVAVLGDIHMGNATMGPRRLGRIVRQVNALRPDLVVLAGDFIAGHADGAAAVRAPKLIAPLKALRSPLGVVAVLGNHDYWTGEAAVRAALERANVTMLDNAARRRGALTLVGVGDSDTGHADIAAAMRAARRLPGPRLVFSHGPDIVPHLPPDAPLVVASHTHCGQVVLPLIGAPAVPSKYGRRYVCGIVRERGRVTIVGAGLGTSVLPIRVAAPPDFWIVTLRGRDAA